MGKYGKIIGSVGKTGQGMSSRNVVEVEVRRERSAERRMEEGGKVAAPCAKDAKAVKCDKGTEWGEGLNGEVLQKRVPEEDEGDMDGGRRKWFAMEDGEGARGETA